MNQKHTGQDEEQADDARLEQKRTQLISAISAGELSTLTKRIAWLLNQYPETRDSDIKLLWRYWDRFEEEYTGGPVTLSDMLAYTNLKSVARARATVQNTLRLFLASPDVQRFRGQAQEEHLEQARQEVPTAPLITVYVDESGKNDTNLILGSVWFLEPLETLSVMGEILKWRETEQYTKEFHFQDISGRNLERFKGFVSMIHAHCSFLGFKAARVPRAGLANIEDAFTKLLYHLLVKGAAHEKESGRVELPRRLWVIRDAEEAGRDSMLEAEITDRMTHATLNQFDSQLTLDSIYSEESHKNQLIQLADLFTGSVNRATNVGLSAGNPKDHFTEWLFELLKLDIDDAVPEHDGDSLYEIVL